MVPRASWASCMLAMISGWRLSSSARLMVAYSLLSCSGPLSRARASSLALISFNSPGRVRTRCASVLALACSFSMLSSRAKVSVRNLWSACWLTVRVSDLPRASSARCTVARWGRSCAMAWGAQRLMSKQSSGNRVAEALLNCIEGIKRPGDYARFGRFPTGGKSAWILAPARERQQGGEIKKTAPQGAVLSVQD
ncbi:hypothetical protein D3C85_670970 [compost metagenome]